MLHTSLDTKAGRHPPRRKNSMKRRDFIKVTGIGVAGAATMAAPAIAQSTPELKWRMAASWPKSLDTLYGGAEVLAKSIAEATDNKFQVQLFAAGEIVPGLQVLDAVQHGTVEMGHTASYYYFGKDPTFAFGTAVPFGPNQRLNQAWYMLGGGKELLNEFYKSYNVTSFLAGNTGCQMGGWFRKEINTVDDEKLGFNKVAPHYYYPGWWEGGPMLLGIVNLDKWNALPKYYQGVIEQAGHYANNWMIAKYDQLNPPAMKKLLAGGTKLHSFSPPIMQASLKATRELYAETAAGNPNFKKVLDSMNNFQS